MRKPPPKTPTTAANPAKSNGEARSRANAALLAAAADGDVFGIRAALQNGADVNTRDARQQTPLLLVIASQKEDAAPRDMAQMEKALRRSAARGDAGEGSGSGGIAPAIQLLLKAGAQVNVVDFQGRSPLLNAVNMEDDVLCKELLRRKANVNFRDPKGVTPLLLAVIRQNPVMVDLLLKNGANVKRHGLEGKMPLLGVVVYRPKPKQDEAEDMGTMMGSLMDALLGGGEAEVITAAIMEMLLRAGADPNEKGNLGVTPLMMAASTGTPRLVRRLLDRGAKLDDLLIDGSSSLFVAADEGRADTARTLMEAGADINRANWKGNTPLMAAAEKACYALVEKLLQAGAKTATRNREGLSARDKAAARHHTAIVRLLDAHKPPGAPA